jgi:hypothetical protein
MDETTRSEAKRKTAESGGFVSSQGDKRVKSANIVTAATDKNNCLPQKWVWGFESPQICPRTWLSMQ